MKSAPFHNDLALGPYGGGAFWTHTDDGVRIRMGHWGTENAHQGTVLLFPGRTEYIEKYGLTAVSFAARGYAVASVDWRGQGLADRLIDDPLKGHVEKFSDYQRDVQAFLKAVEDLNLPKPYYLIGHSMGGCIGLRALMNGLNVKAAAFSAPMWGIELATHLRPLAWIISSLLKPTPLRTMLAPGTSAEPVVTANSFDENKLTRDPEMYAYMRSHLAGIPEIALGGPTLAWLNEALREMRTLSKMRSPAVPTICGLGDSEKIVDPSRIHHRMANWPNGTLIEYAEGEHEVLMEVEATRTAFLAACADHFDANR